MARHYDIWSNSKPPVVAPNHKPLALGDVTMEPIVGSKYVSMIVKRNKELTEENILLCEELAIYRGMEQ